MIKFFHEKLNLRGKEYTMFDEDDEEDLVSSRKGVLNITEDSILGKVFGYFFDK